MIFKFVFFPTCFGPINFNLAQLKCATNWHFDTNWHFCFIDISEIRNRSGSAHLTPKLLQDLQKDRKRIIAKGGQCNVSLDNVPSKKIQFFKDIFTTCVDMKWRYTFTAFVSAFFISWLIFTVLYYIVAYYRGDLEPDHLPKGKLYVQSDNCEDSTFAETAKKNGTPCHTPCVWACEDFTSYFLFSMETQHTIG